MKKTLINPKVNFFFDKESQWQEEYQKLREILLETGLEETLKWGCPCYTYEGSNIVLIHGFKEYFALLLFKGALLKDPKGILIQQTENVQSSRQIRFTSGKEVDKLKKVILQYVSEAVEVEKAGLKVTYKKSTEYKVPEEFQNTLEKDPKLKKAFESLTPGRQRAYLLHFSAPKQSRTRESRIEKCRKQILEGKGLND